ncbi:MAG: hypothetical protein ABSB82_22250 [Terriglobia bacterium]
MPLALGLFCWTEGFATPVPVQDRAPQAARIPPDDYISRANELVRTLYPDLDPHLIVVFEDFNHWGRQTGITSAFYLRLSTYTGSKRDADGNDCDCEKLVLRGLFFFNPLKADRELTHLVVSDPVADARQERFGELIGKHAEWSEAQVIQAMKKAGAKYGPEDKDQLLRALPLAELRPYVGDLHVERAEFVFNRPEGAKPSREEMGAVCFWRLTGTSHLASGAAKDYSLVVDAFDGRLSSIFSH